MTNFRKNGQYIPENSVQWPVPQDIGSRSPCYEVDNSKEPDFYPYTKITKCSNSPHLRIQNKYLIMCRTGAQYTFTHLRP